MKREDFLVNSSNVLNLIKKGYYQGYTSTLVLANVHYSLKKFSNQENSRETLKKLIKIINVLNITDQITEKALYSDFKDFEDAIQYFCALENDIDCIITRNKKDFSKSSIPVYTPTEFLNKFIT